MKNKIYYLINIFFLAISILFINYTGIFQMKFTIYQFLVLILIFLIIHILKFFKIYLILLEEKIPLRVMARLYIKTTFVSTVLPYKTGELFKMYTYGNEIKNYTKGIIAVLVDKFFDGTNIMFNISAIWFNSKWKYSKNGINYACFLYNSCNNIYKF